jgi:cytidine deaminase
MTIDTVATDMRTRLLKAARTASEFAYCPYSKFRVGAAVLAEGEVTSGCNIENASYGLSICAERAAVFTAVGSGRRRIDAIAVSSPDAPGAAPPPARMPCGACLQVIAEFANGNALVIIDGVGEMSLSELLARPFAL